MVFKEIDCTNYKFQIFIQPNYSVEIHRFDKKNSGFNINKFKVGDMAEYDSFNLVYYGKISSITEKTVTVVAPSTFKKRFTWEQFCHKNWDFNLEKAEERNRVLMREGVYG